MRPRQLSLAIALLLIPAVASAQAAAAAAAPRAAVLVGDWAGGLTFQSTELNIQLQFARRDSTVGGLLSVASPEGTIADSTWGLSQAGDTVTFSWNYQNMSVAFRATLVGDTLSGNYSVAGQGSGPWWAVRKKSGDATHLIQPRTSTARPARPAAR